MLSKNNNLMNQKKSGRKFEKYSIKKLKVGAASVLVGAGFFSDDEYCEITPETIRLRKQILNKGEREKANKRKKQAEAENN